jgi:cytochrome c556
MRRKSLSVVAIVAGALGLSTLLYAKSEPEDLIKYRHNTMEAIGGHMGAISLLVRGKVEQTDHLLDHAKALKATVDTINDVFPADSAQGETEAKPEIWQKSEEFKKAVMKAEEAGAAFLAAVEQGDKGRVEERFKELGGSCKNCHDNFRKEKKK